MRFRLRAIVPICWVVLLALLTAQFTGAQVSRPTTRSSGGTAELSEKWCGRVSHDPQEPKSNQPVTITAMVIPAMTGVRVEYQIVEPGAYVELKDPAYSRNWLPVEMKPDPAKATRKYTAYVAQLPADLQKHRRLIRYRIKAKDEFGNDQFWPLIPTKSQQPELATTIQPPPAPGNLAYFVYDALPAWKGAINPKSRDPKQTEVMTFPPEVLGKIQVYHLIAKKRSVENVTWIEQTPGSEYKYTGTLVVDGRVYDHVRYRARGGIWRYALGKNMWKIDMPPGQNLRLKDDLGRPYPVTWEKLNLRSCFQLGAYGHRGEQGLFEAVNFRLWNLVGVHAPSIHWVHFRIISEPDETPQDQYRGDFWGLYQAMENQDGQYLKARNLPDANIHKMQIGADEISHLAEGQPSDGSDLQKFLRGYEGRMQTDQWWRENLNLPSYYSYRSIIECVHHYDIGEGKNYCYYRHPRTGLWEVFPWDADLTWADTMFGDGEEPFNMRVLTRPAFALEYRNRLREIRDLLFNPDQTNQIIDEIAALIGDPERPNSGLLEADRRKWDYHPMVTTHKHAGQGRYYKKSPTGDFAGMIQLMKNYVVRRGFWVDQYLLADPRIPATPKLTYTGDPGYPAGGLRFTPAPYTGRAEFTAVKWRIAEIIPPDQFKPDPKARHAYEITPQWQSADLDKMGEITIPPEGLTPGRTYRVRARTKDTTGRWSHWSAPVEFVLGGR